MRRILEAKAKGKAFVPETRADRLAMKLVARAERGDRAAEIVLDRTEGKVVSTVEFSGSASLDVGLSPDQKRAIAETILAEMQIPIEAASAGDPDLVHKS